MKMLIEIGASQFNLMAISRIDPIKAVKVSQPKPDKALDEKKDVKTVYNFTFRADGQEQKSPDYETLDIASGVWHNIYQGFEKIAAAYQGGK